MTFKINNRLVSSSEPPYLIAEISANHNGNIQNAFKLITAAKNSGADAVKIQTYTPDTMTLDLKTDDFLIKTGLWKGQSLYDLYSTAFTPFEWHAELFKFAEQIGITLFSTPFDESAVDLLEDLGTPAYKLASFELTDLPLLKYIALKQKPILISTGMANLSEIDDAINVCTSVGNNNILLFHCISAYPASLADSTLSISTSY